MCCSPPRRPPTGANSAGRFMRRSAITRTANMASGGRGTRARTAVLPTQTARIKCKRLIFQHRLDCKSKSMDTTNAAKKTKGQWGGRRAGAGRKKGSTSTYMERQEIAGMILGLNDLEHRKKMIRMFREDLTLIQSPAFRFLAPYYFGKVPEPEQQQ